MVNIMSDLYVWFYIRNIHHVISRLFIPYDWLFFLFWGTFPPKVTAIIFMECFICQPKTYEIQV